MALAMRKRVILVKPETTYGTDSAPTTEAILCSNLTLTPLDGSSVSRDFIRPYFGSSGEIRVENFTRVSFDVELAGSGTAGTAPAWGHLLKSCNFSETILGAAYTGTAQAGGTTTTIVLDAGASSTDDFYTGMTVEITGGTGSGQKGEIISYDGTSKTATVAVAWATAPDATSAFSIGENVLYTPNSDFGTGTSNTSSSIYFNVDGVRHILLGARGTFSVELSAKQIPMLKFEFTGLHGTVSDQSLPSADFSGYQVPVTVSTANTTDLNLIGYNGAVLQTLNFAVNNNVIYRQLVGSESVLITDRNVTGNVSIEATTVTQKDWWTFAKNNTYGTFAVKHGQTSGNIIGVTGRNVQMANPNYSDSDGVSMLDFETRFTPYGSAGNDEVRLCVK